MIIGFAFWTGYSWMSSAVVAGAIVFISSVADRRRQKRANMENVGFMPWTLITLLAMLLTVVAVALAIKTGELL